MHPGCVANPSDHRAHQIAATHTAARTVASPAPPEPSHPSPPGIRAPATHPIFAALPGHPRLPQGDRAPTQPRRDPSTTCANASDSASTATSGGRTSTNRPSKLSPSTWSSRPHLLEHPLHRRHHRPTPGRRLDHYRRPAGAPLTRPLAAHQLPRYLAIRPSTTRRAPPPQEASRLTPHPGHLLPPCPIGCDTRSRRVHRGRIVRRATAPQCGAPAGGWATTPRARHIGPASRRR